MEIGQSVSEESVTPFQCKKGQKARCLGGPQLAQVQHVPHSPDTFGH